MNLPNLTASVLRVALLSIGCAGCSQLDSAAGAAGAGYSAQYGLLAPPAPACRIGDRIPDRGAWVDANGASTESDATRRVGASFGQAPAATALQVAMNGDAIRNLAMVEVQDLDGGWHPVWKGAPAGALPQGCASAWFGRKLDGGAPVAALRLTFGRAATQVEVSNARLLQGG